ncbi:Formate--tetrahydrofolate ligase [Gossypium arboreum]|uniref:Formate--tetrahydrofolate ligase n=1 Tax=Gossypium arboreum TaxID=29729 RepID=A0A0B0PX22_GOSAR|nr:Formate--tetrahydrofolate ligase [Gossypium arboreum]
MAKRSNRRPVRYERDQMGCMWGLITMFDFRHGRSTQRLLSDRRRGKRNVVGMGYSGNKIDMSTSSGEDKAMAMDTCKPSVKKLLEEEMSREHATKEELNNTELEAKQFDLGEGDNERKSQKRRNKTRKKSSGGSLDVDAAKTLVSEISCYHKSERQTTSNLDIDNLVEELCQEMGQKRIDCVNRDQPVEGHMQPNMKSSRFEEVSEAIKFLVSQKLINRNQLTEGGELQASKEAMDALQILSLNEELFLKLLRDPNSSLVKNSKNSPNARDEESKPFSGSNFSEQEPAGLRQPNETVNRKQRNFFRRKSKSQERDLSDEQKVSEASTRIVVLKPGPTCPQTAETGSNIGSSPESKNIIRHREPNEKVGSHFFLSEIKRKLRHAMGREQHRIPAKEIPKRLSGERQSSSDNGGLKEYIGMNSPTKDHFFIERIAKPSSTVKKGEKTSKLKGPESSTEYETTHFSRHSNIYIEAKKHLSEMLTNGDDIMDLSGRQVPKTLGRILSLPDYNSSPISSPARNPEPSSITAQSRFASPDKFQKLQNNVSNLSQSAEEPESRPGVSDNKNGDEVRGDNAILNKLDACVNDDKEDQSHSSTKDEASCEGEVIVVEETEITVEGETELLDASSDTNDYSITRDDKNVDMSEVYDEKQYPECSKQDLTEEDQQLFSPLASPSNSSLTKKVEGLEERPSPVSVLEPIFSEDVISPASIRCISGETSIQPLRIRFEEHGGSLATDRSNRFKTCMDDKESIFEYVKAVLEASSFEWDEFYIRSLSSDMLLDPLLLDEVEYLPNQLCHDKSLLFDCINEVLVEVCGYYLGSPGVSFVKTNIRPIPNMKNTIEEIWQGVYWHMLPMPLPRSLDQIVRKDMAKVGTWMDLRLDTDCIGSEISEAIFEDFVEDTITSFLNVSLECEYHAEGLQE